VANLPGSVRTAVLAGKGKMGKGKERKKQKEDKCVKEGKKTVLWGTLICANRH
jgi:hypothetical protein